MRTTPNYQAWKISDKDFPVEDSIESKIKFILKYGLLAPSTHNTQPWQFEVKGDRVLIYPRKDMELSQADPKNRGMFISLGCCIRNIEVAAAYFGFETLINSDKSKVTPVTVSFIENKRSDQFLTSLFNGITKRYSNKSKYTDTPIDPIVLKKLSTIETSHNLKIILSDDNSIIGKVAVLHKESAASYAGNRLFGLELAEWLRDTETLRNDGMPGFIAGLSNFKSKIMRSVIRKFPKVLQLQGKKDQHLIENSPLIGIITSLNDDEASWLEVGMTYETLALTATIENINVTPLAAMIEKRRFRNKLRRALGIKNGVPQMFFRLGYSENIPYHTPRRPLEESLK